jgi:DNA-binding protein H-NS
MKAPQNPLSTHSGVCEAAASSTLQQAGALSMQMQSRRSMYEYGTYSTAVQLYGIAMIRLHQPKSRLYAQRAAHNAKALSAERPHSKGLS